MVEYLFFLVNICVDKVSRAVSKLWGDERGQAVAEYALVLLVVAAIAGTFLVWAKTTGKLDAFFDAIFNQLLGSAQPSPTPAP